MDHKTELLVTRFALQVEQVLDAIVLMGPPFPEQARDVWDGEVIDASDMHEAFDRLPDQVREALRPAYQRCVEVLRGQNQVAGLSYAARCQLMADVLAHTGLSPEQLLVGLTADGHLHLVSELGLLNDDAPGDESATPAESAQDGAAGDDEHENDAADDDDPMAAVLPFARPPGSPGSDDPLQQRSSWARRLWARLGPTSLAAALCLGVLSWHHLSAPRIERVVVPAAANETTLSVEISGHEGAEAVDATVTLDQDTGDTLTELRLPAQPLAPVLRTADDHQVSEQATDGAPDVVKVRTTRRGSHTRVIIDLSTTEERSLQTW